MRLIKKTASIVSSIIIILAIGGYVFVRNFDLNRYKSYIEDIVNRETGRSLKINGEAKLGISFVPTLVVNDVSLSNPEWASNPEMIKLQKLEIKAAILPLLKGRIVIDKLILEQPEIYLETTADGQKNWEFIKNQKPQQKTASAADKGQEKTSAASAAAIGLIAKQVELQDGIVSYFDAQSGKTTIAQIKAVTMEIPGQNESMNLDVDAVLDGKEIGFVGELHPKLQQTYGLPHAPIVFELDVASILPKAVPWHTPVSKFQPISRDLSVVVPHGVTFASLQKAVIEAAKTDKRLAGFVSLDLFDLYHKAADGDKPAEVSMAFRMTVQPEDENYSGEDAEAATQAIIEALAAQGAVLRQ